MKQIAALALAASLSATPVLAQDDERGLSLMEEGARLLLRGLQKEMEPAMKDLQKFTDEIQPGLKRMMDEMGPAFAELFDKIDDITAYHPPEILPNGDIILRRKTPVEQEQDKADEGGEVDL